MSLKNRQIHFLTPFAKVDGARITYPIEDSGATLGRYASSQNQKSDVRDEEDRV